MEISPQRRIHIGIFVFGLVALLTCTQHGDPTWVGHPFVNLLAVALAAFGAGAGWQQLEDRKRDTSHIGELSEPHGEFPID